jgi:MFS family permease
MSAPAAAPPDRTVRTSRTATLLSTASDEAATSLMPGLLTITLATSPIVLGIVEGVASAADGIARLAGGALSEDPRRRRWISGGSYPTMAALTGLIAVAGTGLQVGLLRAASSAARGLRSPQRYAAVPDRVAAAGYGRAFGFERGMHHLASVAGPLLAFTTLALLGVRSAMFVAMVPGLVAAVIGFRLLRQAPAGPDSPRVAPRLRVRAVYRGRIGRLMTGITLFEAANFAAVLLILRATKLLQQRDVLFGAAAMAVLLYVLWRLAAAAASPCAGRAVDRFGPVPVMSVGVGTLLLAYAGFAFVPGTVPQLACCFLLAGAASGAVEAAEHVGVAQVAPADLRWSAFGSLSAVRSFGRVTATVGATVVWTLLGAEYGLLLATPLMLAAIVVMGAGLSRSDGRLLARPRITWRMPGRVLLVGVGLALAPVVLVLLLALAGLLRSYP